MLLLQELEKVDLLVPFKNPFQADAYDFAFGLEGDLRGATTTEAFYPASLSGTWHCLVAFRRQIRDLLAMKDRISGAVTADEITSDHVQLNPQH